MRAAQLPSCPLPSCPSCPVARLPFARLLHLHRYVDEDNPCDAVIAQLQTVAPGIPAVVAPILLQRKQGSEASCAVESSSEDGSASGEDEADGAADEPCGLMVIESGTAIHTVVFDGDGPEEERTAEVALTAPPSRALPPPGP